MKGTLHLHLSVSIEKTKLFGKITCDFIRIRKALADRNNSSLIDTNLNTSTVQSVTQCEAASACGNDERGLGHRRQNVGQ